MLDAQQFQACFMEWVQALNQLTKGQIVPIDGKQLRRSHDKSLGKKAIHWDKDYLLKVLDELLQMQLPYL